VVAHISVDFLPILCSRPWISKVSGPEIAAAHGPKSGQAMARPGPIASVTHVEMFCQLLKGCCHGNPVLRSNQQNWPTNFYSLTGVPKLIERSTGISVIK